MVVCSCRGGGRQHHVFCRGVRVSGWQTRVMMGRWGRRVVRRVMWQLRYQSAGVTAPRTRRGSEGRGGCSSQGRGGKVLVMGRCDGCRRVPGRRRAASRGTGTTTPRRRIAAPTPSSSCEQWTHTEVCRSLKQERVVGHRRRRLGNRRPWRRGGRWRRDNVWLIESHGGSCLGSQCEFTPQHNELQFTIVLTAIDVTLYSPNDRRPLQSVLLFLWAYSVETKSLFVLGASTCITGPKEWPQKQVSLLPRSQFFGGRQSSHHTNDTALRRSPQAQIPKICTKNNYTRTQQTARNTSRCLRRLSALRSCPTVQELSTGGVKGSSTTDKRHFCHLPLPSAGVRKLYGASSRWL